MRVTFNKRRGRKGARVVQLYIVLMFCNSKPRSIFRIILVKMLSEVARL